MNKIKGSISSFIDSYQIRHTIVFSKIDMTNILNLTHYSMQELITSNFEEKDDPINYEHRYGQSTKK